MLRTICAILFIIMLASTAVLAAESAAVETKAEPEVAIVHFDKLAEAKLEGTAKNVILDPVIAEPDQLPYFRLANALYTPKDVTVRILGLTEAKYDLYLDGKLVGSKTREVLEAGFPISIPGTKIPQDYREYLSNLRNRASEAVKRYESLSGDGGTCHALLQGVCEWVGNLEINDQDSRMVRIVVVPVDHSTLYPSLAREDEAPGDMLGSTKKMADVMQQVRKEVSETVTSDLYKYDVLSVMTPMDFTITTGSQFTPGKKSVVKVVLTSKIDREIAGDIKLRVPSGWTVTKLSSAVRMHGYKQTSEAKFEVTPGKKAEPNVVIGANAVLKVEGVVVKLQAKKQTN